MARSALDQSAAAEADALLASLRMAERHRRWKMFGELLGYIEDAGGRFLYLGFSSYAIELPIK